MASDSGVKAHAQAHALRGFGRAPVSLGLYSLLRGSHDRVILTGAGASHIAALSSWRRLVSHGMTVSRTDARQLIDNPTLITPHSMLIATSRSGRNSDVIELVETFSTTTRPAVIIAVTDELASPLARLADGEILLRSQSAVASRGFLNALAAHDYIASMILGEDNDDVMSTARVVAATTFPRDLAQLAAGVTANPDPGLAYVGFGEHAATALYAALLTQETTQITAKGYTSDQFDTHTAAAARHGSTAVLFVGRDPEHNNQAGELAAELTSAGATVVVVGGSHVDGATCIRSPIGHLSAEVAHSVMIAEHFVSSLAA
jgi:fructoselysine-6-P-deglycase FrlB-like protein